MTNLAILQKLNLSKMSIYTSMPCRIDQFTQFHVQAKWLAFHWQIDLTYICLLQTNSMSIEHAFTEAKHYLSGDYGQTQWTRKQITFKWNIFYSWKSSDCKCKTNWNWHTESVDRYSAEEVKKKNSVGRPLSMPWYAVIHVYLYTMCNISIKLNDFRNS